MVSDDDSTKPAPEESGAPVTGVPAGTPDSDAPPVDPTAQGDPGSDDAEDATHDDPGAALREAEEQHHLEHPPGRTDATISGFRGGFPVN